MDGCIISEGVYRNYFEMKNFCESINAQLVIIHSEEENDRLGSTFPAESTFLGVQLQGDRLMWNDGSTSSYTHWLEGEPNNKNAPEDCVAYWNGGKYYQHWLDYPCTSRFYTVCKLKDCDAYLEKEMAKQKSDIDQYIDRKQNDILNSIGNEQASMKTTFKSYVDKVKAELDNISNSLKLSQRRAEDKYKEIAKKFDQYERYVDNKVNEEGNKLKNQMIMQHLSTLGQIMFVSAKNNMEPQTTYKQLESAINVNKHHLQELTKETKNSFSTQLLQLESRIIKTFNEAFEKMNTTLFRHTQQNLDNTKSKTIK
ncbi:low affinity immunoglobulin epsilon Fc receptor-like protein [Leptotrombidium deliense]|uniref:Low affinity immunoglobulin epsilon Fc receptor-like protein n=1 Tax=Leptotrombidium deliense TaxID=299467 RepID=A0A443S3U9_9ACAR|nr:low affinity immunoglobulin epsilon Fc receptor-like protein [Leptotrombidium deliense]